MKRDRKKVRHTMSLRGKKGINIFHLAFPLIVNLAGCQKLGFPKFYVTEGYLMQLSPLINFCFPFDFFSSFAQFWFCGFAYFWPSYF